MLLSQNYELWSLTSHTYYHYLLMTSTRKKNCFKKSGELVGTQFIEPKFERSKLIL